MALRGIQLDISNSKFSRGGISEYSLKQRRKEAITAAKELHYDSNCIEELKEATSVGAIEHILTTYRRRKFK